MDHKIDDFASILNPRHALRLAHKTILDANVNVWVEAPKLPSIKVIISNESVDHNQCTIVCISDTSEKGIPINGFPTQNS